MLNTRSRLRPSMTGRPHATIGRVRQPIIPQLGGPEFLLWEQAQTERYELHHGFVFAFPGGTVDHDRIAFNTRMLLERSLMPPCRTFGSDVKVRIASNSYYYPDVTVACDGISGTATAIEKPTIVVEVLSPGTQSYDVVEKRAGYRAVESLKAYVIIHTEIRRVELDARNLGGLWKTEILDLGEARFEGALIAIDEIYQGTSLDR